MKKNLELGKIVLVTYGPKMGKIGMVIDIIDEKRCIIDGPCGRQVINLKRIEVTNIKVNVKNKMTSKDVYLKFSQTNVLKKWYNTFKGKKVLKSKEKFFFTDFDSFKFMVGKKHVSRWQYLKKETFENLEFP